jgi:hypothetical protein
MVFIILLISRIGDVLTTRIATPTLKHEMNLLVRKLRWPFAYATILLSAITFYDINIATAFAVASLLVSASNATKMWTMKTLGEEEYHVFFVRIVKSSSVPFSLFCFWLPSIFFFLLSVIIVLFTLEKGVFIAAGMIAYGLIMGMYSTIFYFKTRKAVICAS